MIQHGERAHALLSASNSKRWINCNPSARLEEQFPSTTSTFAEEGTLAHEFADFELKLATKEITKKDYNKQIKEKQKSELYNDEMLEHAKSYTEYVLNTAEENSLIMTEQKVDYSQYVQEGFGTSDAIVITNNVMHVVDFKYGKGVQVEAEDNTQMMCYALGAYCMFSQLYDIEMIHMHIFQPRLDNFSVAEISVKDLLEWADEILKPAAEMAFKGEGEYVPGEHCKFCRAKNKCNARAQESMELIKQDFIGSPVIDDERIEDILPKVDAAIKYLTDIKTYALEQALAGKKWKGFKLVEGRSNRKYIDELEVLKACKAAEIDELIVTERKILGITAMEKALGGKKKAEEIIGHLIEKPAGAPTLVLESDKRQALELKASAVEDFE